MEFSKRDIILETWNTLKEHLGLWILIMLFIFILNIIISTVQDKLLEDITIQTILFTVAAYLFQAGIGLGMLKIALNIHNGIETGFNHVLGSFHLLVTYVLASVIFLVLIVTAASPGIILLMMTISADIDLLSNIGGLDNLSFSLPLLLMIIPAVYASIRLQFYDYYLVDVICGAISAIKKSIAVTRGRAGALFLLGATLSVIILISMIPLMLGLLISIPLAIMVNTRVYYILKNYAINE